jgi:hypothetical protein
MWVVPMLVNLKNASAEGARASVGALMEREGFRTPDTSRSSAREIVSRGVVKTV